MTKGLCHTCCTSNVQLIIKKDFGVCYSCNVHPVTRAGNEFVDFVGKDLLDEIEKM